jgi:isochorismate synthase
MSEVSKQEISINQPLDIAVSNIFEYCILNNFGVATWRSPLSSVINILIDFTSGIQVDDVNLERSKPGFLFAPFDVSKKKIFLEKQLLIQWDREYKFETTNNDLAERLLKYVNEVKINPEESELKHTESTSNNENTFTSLVSKSIKEIKKGIFSKVVPTRMKTIQFENEINLGNYFQLLVDAYKSAFVSLTYTPYSGIWMGATPELLISTSGNLFKTVALAGTLKFDPAKSMAEIAWTQKEIEEQALVSRYIINCFKKIRLREFDEIGPKTVQAGNLIHLKTEFLVNMQETNFPELGSTMLKLLHPTSAVCGMPLESSYTYINENEAYDREYFTGFLGPVNIESTTNLFVNLRCMKVEKNQITLFAGAGVTEDSQPEKEWIETEMKMNTILNIINPI